MSADDVDTAIDTAAQNPKRMKDDIGEIEEYSLQELIDAAKYLRSKDAVDSEGGWAIRKIIAGGP